MSYRWGDHVGELELAIEAASEADVFAEATRAFAELLGDGPAGPPERRRVDASGHDRAALLAEYLDELVYLAETEGFVPRELEQLELSDDALAAVVAGHRGDPPHLVKAVTRHRLAFAPANGGWCATLVLDV